MGFMNSLLNTGMPLMVTMRIFRSMNSYYYYLYDIDDDDECRLMRVHVTTDLCVYMMYDVSLC